MLGHNLCVERRISDVFGKCPIGLSATKTQTVVIGLGEFHCYGFGEFAKAACSRSPFGFDFIAVTHFTWFIVISHFTVMMYLTICDHWERIVSTISGVERSFLGCPKDNLAPFQKQKLHASVDSRMPDGSNADFSYNLRHCSKSSE